MSPEDRRRMIVRAVLPLVVEHGAAITSSQIARAAGIGEGTIFRAFKDKDELLDACVLEALKPDDVLTAVAEIPLDQPLDKRLVEATDALGAHLQRMGALMAATHASGRVRHRDPEQASRRGRRGESMAVMREVLAELFEPEKDKLRLPADQLASLFLSLLLTRARLEDNAPSIEELVDVFLNGAVETA